MSGEEPRGPEGLFDEKGNLRLRPQKTTSRSSDRANHWVSDEKLKAAFDSEHPVQAHHSYEKIGWEIEWVLHVPDLLEEEKGALGDLSGEAFEATRKKIQVQGPGARFEERRGDKFAIVVEGREKRDAWGHYFLKALHGKLIRRLSTRVEVVTSNRYGWDVSPRWPR